MRGKHNGGGTVRAAPRITPAHAGKTCSLRLESSPRPDHPRACGENTFCRSRATFPSGSPPRMRGKPVLSFPLRHDVRITPAHAGKTELERLMPLIKSDHPRACGENTDFSTPKKSASGSPPRMRGKLLCIDEVFELVRITPAHAGKTVLLTFTLLPAPDHPRACGENP